MRTKWLWGGFGVALGWLWVALGGLSPLFLLSAFCCVLLLECGFGWLAALPRSRFEVRRSRFDVQPPAGTSNGGKPPAARLPQAWLILLGQAEAGGAPGILKVIPRESRNRNQISLNAETRKARRSTARQSRNRMDKDRIMAGQNHVEPRRDLRWQDLKRQGRMILSCHDSVCL